MTEFRKYLEVETLGKDEVDGILLGECYIFPKIDGTNSSVWLDEQKEIQAGSRNRLLTLDRDNAGFRKEVFSKLFADHFRAALGQLGPGAHIYGEWLVPHTLKTYRSDAWRRFYVFDVANDIGYLRFDDYANICREALLEVIEPLAIITNPTVAQLENLLSSNTYLIEQGSGAGEGIVIKNYNFRNKWGRQAYAKLVRNEFKEQFHRVMGPVELQGQKQIELEIASDFVTLGRVNKVIAKIGDCERRSLIPQLLHRVYHEIVTEELWDLLKTYKNPKLDFRLLNQAIIAQIKVVKPEIF